MDISPFVLVKKREDPVAFRPEIGIDAFQFVKCTQNDISFGHMCSVFSVKTFYEPHTVFFFVLYRYSPRFFTFLREIFLFLSSNTY